MDAFFFQICGGLGECRVDDSADAVNRKDGFDLLFPTAVVILGSELRDFWKLGF